MENKKTHNITPQIEKLISSYVNSLDISISSKTTYTTSLKVFYEWFLGNYQRSKQTVQKKHIILFKRVMFNKKRSEYSVSLYMSSLRGFFNWMIKAKKITENPMEGIKKERTKKEFRRKPLNINQVKQLLHSFDKTDISELRDYIMVYLMITLGLRRIELVRMNVSDFSDNELYIQGKFEKSKNECLLVGGSVKAELTNYISTLKKATPTTPMFSSYSNRNKNTRISFSHISAMVKAHLRKVGINDPQITCHSLRHTCAVLLLTEGNNIYATQVQLRHSSVDITRCYTHFIEKQHALKVNSAIMDNLFTAP